MPYDEDIVDDQWQPPHRYGSTIYDIFRPRPGAQRELYQNLYGAGFMGDVPYNVKESRTPFGRLLQGVGLLGEPDPRPLTPYEQMLVEEGRHHRGEEDYQTEKQRMDKIKSAYDIGKDVIGSGGGMPSEEFGLPEGMQGNLRNMYSEYNQEQGTKKEHNDLVIQSQKADIAYKKAMTENASIQKALLNASREIEDMKKYAALPQIHPLYVEYETLRGEVVKAINDGDQDAASIGMSKMQQLSQVIAQAVTNAGAGSLVPRMTPNAVDIFAPYQKAGPNTNQLNQPADVDYQLRNTMNWPPGDASKMPIGR